MCITTVPLRAGLLCAVIVVITEHSWPASLSDGHVLGQFGVCSLSTWDLIKNPCDEEVFKKLFHQILQFSSSAGAGRGGVVGAVLCCFRRQNEAALFLRIQVRVLGKAIPGGRLQSPEE